MKPRHVPAASFAEPWPQFAAGASEACRIRKSVTRAASSSLSPARGNIDGVMPRHWSWVKLPGSRGHGRR